MKKISIAAAVILSVLALYPKVFADTPVVTMFNAPTSLESGQIANFGWTINGGGHSLIIFCSQGIKLLYASNGQAFPCDTRISISPVASDGVSVIVANESGSPRIITARIIPKDGNVVDYDLGAKEVAIYVNPDRQPISTFFSNATSTLSGVPTTFTWTSTYLDGVNVRIDCNDSITATSSIASANTFLPCGLPAFPSDLPGSGSVSILFTNQSNADLPLNITLLPAMSPGIYDGTHPQTIPLSVASDIQKPLAVSFSASRTKIYSGDSVSFSWSITNGIGANLKLACSPYLQFLGFSMATTTSLPCNDYGWQTPFGAVGSTTITFINSSTGGQNTTVTIFPELKNGTFAGYAAKNIQISVEPLSAAPSALIQPTASSSLPTAAAASAPTTATPATTASAAKNIFTRPLDIGSRGSVVTSLQTFLAKDKNLYPEGLVTGYFGPITSRAVGRLQIKYGLVKSAGDPAYGFVGVKTRALLNSLQ